MPIRPMFGAIAVLATSFLPATLAAQDVPSVFSSRADYETFVDTAVYGGNYGDLVVRLGGGDEYSAEQLAQIDAQFRQIFEAGFTDHGEMHAQDLGSGFRQEARAYWSGDGIGYLYFYALVHQRDDAFIVLRFAMNTEVDDILSKF